MSISSLSFRFSKEADTSLQGGGLLMEQEPWEESTGKTSLLDIISELYNTLYSGSLDYDIYCGVDSDDESSITVEVNVYPYVQGMHFNIGTTHGSLSLLKLEDTTISESLSFRLSDKIAPSYPVSALMSKEVKGEFWGEDGSIIINPVITFSDGYFRTQIDSYGTISVKYIAKRYVYKLKIPPRVDVSSGVYDSFVYANWNGGAKLLEIDSPHGAEEDYLNDEDCNSRGGSIVIINPDDGDEPIAETVTRIITINYCTQKIISDEVY